uniref:Sugar phosphate transporter domain-containing protein n=1 Tax=Timema genevievae TaxID=629358 RepID=A0A7R9K0W3_TIMGE|nr:unnamed protein product [Timema genevievae]
MVSEGLLVKYAHITAVVSGYWFISILTVFVNKALLSSNTVNLDAPLFVTWYQCVVSSAICFALNRLSKLFPQQVSFPNGSPFDPKVVKDVLPLAILFTAMIAFNNLCLKYVDVSFYYIGRSLTTVFNVVLTYVILHQKTSYQTVICCSIIVSGFWLGVDQESVAGSLSILGTLFGVLGSLSLSLYSIYTKRVLPLVDQQIWLLSYYNNVYSMFLFLPLIAINQEIPVIMRYEKLFDLWFWFLMSIGGLCGFAIGFFTALQIKVTSALTHNISGTAKACAQTVIATFWYNEMRSGLWWLSNWVVLAGSAAYARVKQKEMEKEFSLKDSPIVFHAVHGNFSGSKMQEILVSRGKSLELLSPDPNTGKVLASLKLSRNMRSLADWAVRWNTSTHTSSDEHSRTPSSTCRRNRTAGLSMSTNWTT